MAQYESNELIDYDKRVQDKEFFRKDKIDKFGVQNDYQNFEGKHKYRAENKVFYRKDKVGSYHDFLNINEGSSVDSKEADANQDSSNMVSVLKPPKLKNQNKRLSSLDVPRYHKGKNNSKNSYVNTS